MSFVLPAGEVIKLVNIVVTWPTKSKSIMQAVKKIIHIIE
jgi:hypothetical protein